MIIQSVTLAPLKNYSPQNKLLKKENSKTDFLQENRYNNINYSQIAFGAIYNVKQTKLINIDSEKNKLLKTISGMLSSQTDNCAFEDLLINTLKTNLNQIRTKFQRQKVILEELAILSSNVKTMNSQQQLNKLNQLKKEFKLLNNNKLSFAQKNEKIKDENFDYQLLNKFKTAILEENFNLKQVFLNHFNKLNNITSIKDLNKNFPQIKIPQNPAYVIAKKIEAVLTRDFYEKIDNLYERQDDKQLAKLTSNTIQNFINQISKSFNVDSENITNKIAPYIKDLITTRYAHAKVNNCFSAIPEVRKIKTPQITENDIKLLSVDFDDFVLSILKKQYLESQKLNEIIYENGNTSITLNSIKEPEYKFEKVSEKIKKIIKTADTLHNAQRDYNNFDTKQLKDRLNFYANNILGNNEEILEHIINFDSSRFTPEDTKNAIRFLRELDSVQDRKKTIHEALDTIVKENINPRDTERLNELEKQKAAEKFKFEQKKAFELKTLKEKFDDTIDMLYSYNLNNIANTCSKYRPATLDKTTCEDAEFIINTVRNNINGDSANTNKLEANIIRWDTYKFYKNYEKNNPILIKAVEFAKEADGSTNIDKAGKYIINTELVENYPQSLELVKTPEIFTKIMEKSGYDTENAVKYLCKYDDYQDLNINEKTYLSELFKIFDTKDNIDKILLRFIIENDYIKTDTTIASIINDKGSESINATINSKAKQQIYNKYKYPICVDYLKYFEDALSSFAGATGESGIKLMGRNNKALEHRIELKLKGHDDRLFSSRNDYYFDIFSDKGLH